MNYKILVFLFLTAIYAPLYPQSSTDTLTPQLEKIKTKHNVLGMSVAVVWGDSIICQRGF